MAKRPEGVSVITDRFKYDPFNTRTGTGRVFLEKASHLPVVGGMADVLSDTLYNRSPLEIYRKKKDEGGVAGETDIPFGKDNRTLMMTTALDGFFYLWGAREWEKERAEMAQGLRKGLFDPHGNFSADTWLRARSSLGPKVLANVVQGALRDRKPVPHFTEVMTMFEHKEDTAKKRHDFTVDGLITLASMFGGGAVDYAFLRSLPETAQVIANPEIQKSLLAGGAEGVIAGILLGIGIDALPGKDLTTGPKIAIPIATGVLGALASSWAVQTFVLPGINKTIQVTHVPLDAYGWTIPVAAGVGGIVVGLPRFIRHRKAHDAISSQIEQLGEWRDMFAVMANSIHYMRNVGDFMNQEPSPDSGYIASVNKHIYSKNVPLSLVVEQFDHRDPTFVTGLQNVAGTTLKELAEGVLFAEMMSFDRGYASHTVKGDPNTTIKGLVPAAGAYFAKLDENGLKAADDTCDLVKTLGDKGDFVAALSVISPSLAPIMITQAQMGKLGPNDDTQHFGEAGMNTGTRGYFIELVKATFSKLLTVPDSKRAELTKRLHDLGSLYEKSIPIGGLDRIYNPPAHLNLGALYGYAFLRARGHKLTDPADPGSKGEYGSKGLLSDVGKAALGAFKQNPLVTYMFLADVAVAIENADNLLVNVNHANRRQIKHALMSLQREISTEIIRQVFPKDKETAVAFFTKDKDAFEAYLALTMLTEVCGDDVILPIIARQGAVLSPIFGLNDARFVPTDPLVQAEREFPSAVKFNGIVGDTPNLYTPQIIDFVHNAARHNTKTHKRLEEFLRRGMLPLLTREYLDRLIPGGRGERFDQAQRENTLAFAGYALESVHTEDLVHLDNSPSLIRSLISVMEDTSRTIQANLAPLGTLSVIPEDIQGQAGDAYRRTMALIQIAARVGSKRGADLQVTIPGTTVTYVERINALIEEISKKTSSTIRVRMAPIR